MSFFKITVFVGKDACTQILLGPSCLLQYVEEKAEAMLLVKLCSHALLRSVSFQPRR